MANTIKQKELRRDWPCVTGLDANSKHEGRVTKLVPEKSVVPKRQEIGMT